MEEYVLQIIGKTISSVIIRKRKSFNPRCQILISFEEGGHFEFYCPDEMIKSAKGMWSDDAFKKPSGDGIEVVRVGHPAHTNRDSVEEPLDLEYDEDRLSYAW